MERKKSEIRPFKHISRRTIGTLAGILALSLLSGGCNALKRGDLHRETENSLYFTEFGFRTADNPVQLTRDAMASVSSTDNNVFITVPYYDNDTATGPNPLNLTHTAGNPLIVSFATVGDETLVEYYDTTSIFDWVPVVSGVTPIPFHDFNVFDPVQFRISKQKDFGEYEQTEFWIYLEKVIRPAIINNTYNAPYAEIDLAYVDEYGTAIPLTAPIDNLEFTEVGYDGYRINWVNGPAWTVTHYDIDVRPNFPGEHYLYIPDYAFTDDYGYPAMGADLVFNYEPPAVRLSHNGDDWLGAPGGIPNTGIKPNPPVKSWSAALESLQDNNSFDLFIAASSTPYDMNDNSFVSDGGVLSFAAPTTLDLTLKPGSYYRIYGGFDTSFTNQYTGNWDSRLQTILVSNSQTDGISSTNPGYGLRLSGLSSDHVLDNLQISSLDDINDSTALLLDGGSSPTLYNVTVLASQGTGDAAAMTLLGGSSPGIRDSRFVGKDGGSGTSIGIRMNNSVLNLEDNSVVLGGDIPGSVSYGIWSDGMGNISINDSFLTAGLLDPGRNLYTESAAWALYSENTPIYLHNSWLHAHDAVNESKSLYISNTAAASTEIQRSTLVSGDAQYSRCIDVEDGDGTANLYLYNSVLLAGSPNSGGDSIAVELSVMSATPSRISGNAIRIRDAANAGEAVGISAINAPALEVHNNLIWSDLSPHLIGIRSDNATGVFPLRHNNFWKAGSTAVEIQMNVADGLVEPSFYQNIFNHGARPVVSGNINYPVTVDTSFNYNTGDTNVGRIIGSIPDDVGYGGEDLSGIVTGVLPPPEDREYRFRSVVSGVGASIGPYEYGSDTYLPSVIHVSPGGDDGYPLGTKQRPFATLARAYDAARGGLALPARWDTYEIRVETGDYDVSDVAGGTYLQPFTEDVTITGGWNQWFSTQSPRSTTLFRTDTTGPLMEISGNTVTNSFRLHGFNLENRTTGASTTLLINGFAAPTVEQNSLTVNTPWNIGVLKALEANSGAAPLVRRNTFTGNTAAITFYSGIELNASGPGTVVEDNTIDGGWVLAQGWQMVIDNSEGLIRHNTLSGITSVNAASRVTGVEIGANCNNINLQNNEVSGGSAETVIGVSIQGASSPKVNGNTINGGTGTVLAVGIDMTAGTASPQVEGGNIITGGTAPLAIGVDITGGSPYFESNTITGGTGNAVMAFQGDGTNATLNNNTLSGGTAINQARGVFLTNGSNGAALSNNTVDAGTASAAGGLTRGIHINLSASFVVENVVDGGNADETVGIHIQSSSPSVERNNIDGGTSGSTGLSTGIFIDSAGGLIKENSILGGTGSSTRGLFKETPGVLLVENNHISGGTGLIDSTGVELNDADGSGIYNNVILGGFSPDTRGISVVQVGNVNIYNNEIFGGISAGDSTGVELINASGATLYNNLVHAGTRSLGDIRGVQIIDGQQDVRLFNNIIYGGRSISADSSVVETSNDMTSSAPRVNNNILINGTAGGIARGFNQLAVEVPFEFNNNLLLSINPYSDPLVVAYEASGTPFGDEGSIEGFIGGGATLNRVRFDENPADTFVRFRYAGGENEFLGDDWHFSGGGQTGMAMSGGMDLSGFFTTDHDGQVRTPSWSMGAFELD